MWKDVSSTGGAGTTTTRTYFLYDGDQIVNEFNTTGEITAVNTWGPVGLIERRDARGDVFYQLDMGGNVVQRLNRDNTVRSTDSFDAYGNRIQIDGDNAVVDAKDPFGYRAKYGYYTDAETGLILCLHRYYDPAAGRWLTRDPIGYAGGLNLYAYCGNEPVVGIDASGYSELGDESLPDPIKKIINRATIMYDKAKLSNNEGLMNKAHYVAELARASVSEYNNPSYSTTDRDIIFEAKYKYFDAYYLDDVPTMGQQRDIADAVRSKQIQAVDFDADLKQVLKWEGGYSNDVGDSGGATMWGITHTDYDAYRKEKGLPTQSVKSMTTNERDYIYRNKYFDAVHCGDMPAPIGMAAFDVAVNNGTGRARQFLRVALKLKPDAGIEAIVASARVANPQATAKNILDQREAKYRAIVANNKSQGKFLKGWLARNDDLRDFCGKL